MKRLIPIFLLLSIFQIANAQHYGGLQFSTLFLKNTGQNFNWSVPEFTPEENETTIGYSIGYQGMIFPNRRFSLLYGINYVKTYVDNYNDFYYLNSSEPDPFKTGIRTTFEDLELPVTLRWNIIKEAKFQPYISLAPTLLVPLKTERDFILSDGALESVQNNYNRGVAFHMDLGAGVNYHISKNAVVNLHMSYRRQSRDIYRFSTGLSFIIKF